MTVQPVATLQGNLAGNSQSDRLRPVILSGWLYVPYEAIGGRSALDQLRQKLTFLPKAGMQGEQPHPIQLYHDWSAREYLGVPRSWGLAAFRGRGLPLIDKTTDGAHEVNVPRLPDFDHPRVLDPAAQRAFYEALVAKHATQRGFIAKAGTGTGKTVVSLREAGAVIKRPTLILLHLERLMWQWYAEIADKLGVDESRIGVAQSDRCDYEGKDFVVGMLHSVAQREYAPGFYRHFGHVIYDEVHKVGSQFFAPVVYRFPSRFWLGLSATVERTDRGEIVFFVHLGKIEVQSDAEALPMDVIPLRYTAKRPPKGKSPSARLKALSEDAARNRWLVSHILDDFRAGRQCLYVSEYVGHAQTIMQMCEDAGIPPEAMGQYTGQRHSGPYCPLVPQTVKLGEYTEFDLVDGPHDGTKIRVMMTKPILASRLRRRADGTFAPVMGPERDGRGRIVTKVKKTDVPAAELDFVKKHAQLVFATYGMIVEGIDEPRWDAGMDLLPRSKATQLIGRIRRPLAGKPRPYWKTPVDTLCNVSMRRFGARCKQYKASGATIGAMQ